MFRRIRKLDRVILLVAVPLWLVCFPLSVRSVLKPGGSMSIRVTMLPAADEYAEIVAMASHEPVAEAGVRLGDRLIEIDGADLRGANGLAVWLRFVRAAWEHPEVPVLLERDGRRFKAAIPPVRLSILAPLVWMTPIFLIFGVAMLLKGPRSGAARAAFHLCVAVALFFSGQFTGPGWVPLLSVVVLVPVAVVLGPLTIRTLLVFPHGVMPRSPWLRALPYPFAIVGLAQTSLMLGIPYSGRYVEPFAASQSALVLVVALLLLARIYRRVDPLGRRRIKFSFLGLYLACIPGLLAGAWLALHPEDWSTLVYAFSALGLTPCFFYLTLHRYDLFDVDRLLSATAAYNVVLFLLAGAWLFLAPQVGEFASAQLGGSRDHGTARGGARTGGAHRSHATPAATAAGGPSLQGETRPRRGAHEPRRRAGNGARRQEPAADARR